VQPDTVQPKVLHGLQVELLRRVGRKRVQAVGRERLVQLRAKQYGEMKYDEMENEWM
jgi:hypothetical protein